MDLLEGLGSISPVLPLPVSFHPLHPFHLITLGTSGCQLRCIIASPQQLGCVLCSPLTLVHFSSALLGKRVRATHCGVVLHAPSLLPLLHSQWVWPQGIGFQGLVRLYSYPYVQPGGQPRKHTERISSNLATSDKFQGPQLCSRHIARTLARL